MQALSIRQPWASLIASGLKDIENRTWQTAKAPGRFLIHATKSKVPGDFEDYPLEMLGNVRNCRQMGQIPEYKNLPYGAVIGYVDCPEIVNDADSPWAQPDSFHWRLENAWLFDEPVYGVNGVQGHLFDVPQIDENNLPQAHQVKLVYPDIVDDLLILPLSDSLFERVVDDAGFLSFAYTETMDFLLTNPETGDPRDINTVRFIKQSHPSTVIERSFVSSEIIIFKNEKGKPYMLEDIPDVRVPWADCEIHYR